MLNLIMPDILMQDMDGYSVFTTLTHQDKTREIPVVFITSISGNLFEDSGSGMQNEFSSSGFCNESSGVTAVGLLSEAFLSHPENTSTPDKSDAPFPV